MKLLWPQSYLYILIGASSALLGWHLSQLTLLLGLPLNIYPVFLYIYPVFLFASTSLTLCLGITAGEIFLNNPTRPKLAWLRLRPSLRTLSLTALLYGLGAGIVTLLILLPFFPLPATLLRIASWALVGGATGHAEGQAWATQSLEAGDKQHAQTRIKNSREAGIAAGVAAGLLFELLRAFLKIAISNSDALKIFQDLEEPLGLGLLGATLGYFLSCTTSPTYRAALRAGAGFEFSAPAVQDDPEPETPVHENLYPRIRPQEFSPDRQSQETSPFQDFLYWLLPFLKPPASSGMLKFVNRSGYGVLRDANEDEDDRIEEGLSIQLPAEGRILIGNPVTLQAKTHIVLPDFPPYCAHLDVTPTSVTLTVSPKYRSHLRRNLRPINHTQPIVLHHNDVLTFSNPNPDYAPKFYRFVYYNRFLDPQA